MGYNTNFHGKFNLEPKLNIDQYNQLFEFAEERHERPEFPGVWCQWVPNKEGDAIQHDGGEKFYCQVEWIQHLIKNFLNPWNIKVNGKVTWQGDELGDLGIIYIFDSVITVKEFNLEKGEFDTKVLEE